MASGPPFSTGGVKIPDAVKKRVTRRILEHADRLFAGRFTRIDVRFRGPLCYIDAYLEPVVSDNWPPASWEISREQYIEDRRTTPMHLCRIRYFGDEEQWSLAFFTYSNETYQPCVFHNGDFLGTPEEAFDIGAVYLDD